MSEPRIVYLTYDEFNKKLKEIYILNQYSIQRMEHNGTLEIQYYDQNGYVIYRPRTPSSLEKAMS